MRIHSDNLTLSDTDMSNDITSDAIWLGHIANFAIQVKFSGAVVTGSFKLQGSVDEPDKSNPAGTTVSVWTDIVNSSQTITEAGDHMWSGENIGYTFIRLVWDNSNGTTGTIDSARFMLKGV